MADKYNIGFALSGGFIRGFAHLGAVKALGERGFAPEIISGVSAGSIAGVFLADGYGPEDILQCFDNINFLDLTRFAWKDKGGLMKLDQLMMFLEKNLRATRFEDLKIPLVVTATDLDRGRSVHFSKGEIAPRIAASCCLPPIFTPVHIDGTEYVDGGVLMNLPVATIRPLCERVVAINVVPMDNSDYKKNAIGVALRSFHLATLSNSIWARMNADVLIEVDNLNNYINTDIKKRRQIFDKGYESTCRILDSFETKKNNPLIPE